MPNVLLIGAVLVAILIILAGWVIVGHRREQRDWVSMGAAERPRTATELAGEGTAGRETAAAPGASDDPAEPDLDGSAPAGPERAAGPQASGTTAKAPDPDGPRAGQDRPRANADGPRARPAGPRAEQNGPLAKADGPRAKPGAPRAERDEPQAEAQPSKATVPAHDPHGPRTEPAAPRAAPNGQPAVGDVTVSDRIGSYYDEADRAMSDYLAAMGWTEEQETRRTG